MASIRTAIELYDAFSAPMMSIIQAVDQGVSAMESFQTTMNEPVSTSIADDITAQMNQAMQAIDEARERLNAPLESPSLLVHWDSPTMDIFTNTGVERFQQEVQSANDMLNTLNQTQSGIAQTAAQTDLFPASAVSDMNNMQNRLQAIQQRIQTIENNPLNMGTDTANAELEQLRAQLDQAVQEQEMLNAAVENMDVQAANEAYLRLSQTVGNTERYIRDNVNEQGRFNQTIEQGTDDANELMSTIMGAVAAYATIGSVKEIMSISDELVQTTSRINLMNDGLQSTQDLMNMIYLKL